MLWRKFRAPKKFILKRLFFARVSATRDILVRFRSSRLQKVEPQNTSFSHAVSVSVRHSYSFMSVIIAILGFLGLGFVPQK